MTYHAQWAAVGMDVTPGTRAWYCAFSRPYEPAPPPPQEPVSVVGRKVADVLAKLRQEREGSPMRQVSAPRKARSHRAGEVTITEYGATKGLGPRQIRKVLLRTALMDIEVEARTLKDGRPDYRETARLSASAIGRGLGRNIVPHDGPEYDVLTAKGQHWADAKLRRRFEARKTSPRHVTREAVRNLLSQGKTQAEIVRLTGLSKQIVSHHAKKLAA